MEVSIQNLFFKIFSSSILIIWPAHSSLLILMFSTMIEPAHRVYKIFYVLLTVHLGIILVNKQLAAQFFFNICFISILYMFWVSTCPSSEELIVSIRHLVYVTLYRWPSGAQVWMEIHGFPFKPVHQTVMYTEWHIPDVVLIQLILLMMSN
jgi:hypothetical protein